MLNSLDRQVVLPRLRGHADEGGDDMEIGARNRLEGEVIEIKRGTLMCQVRVRLAGGAQMESVMTIDSADEMGLKVGDKVRVAVKAVNVLLLKD
jgi:molybdopterin-binding protein